MHGYIIVLIFGGIAQHAFEAQALFCHYNNNLTSRRADYARLALKACSSQRPLMGIAEAVARLSILFA